MRRATDAGWNVLFTPTARCVHVGGAAHGGRMFRENVRGHLRYLSLHGRPGEAETARKLLRASLVVRGRLYRGERGRLYREAACPGSARATSTRCSRDEAEHAAMSGLGLLLQLVFGLAVVLAPGALLARTLGVRGVSGTLAWGLALVFAALAMTFVVHGSLTLTLVLLLLAGAGALAVGIVRGRRSDDVSSQHGLPHLGAVFAAGALLGLLLWHVAGHVGGDGFFHLARIQKLLAFGDLSLGARTSSRTAACTPATRSRSGTASSR